MWKARRLSMTGKKLIINTYALSGIWYIGRIRGIPDQVLKEINKIIFEFFWHPRKNEMIKRTTLEKPEEEGGLGLINIENKLTCFNFQKIQDALKNPDKPWVSQVIYRLGYKLRHQKPEFGSNKYTHTFSRNETYKRLHKLIDMLETNFPGKKFLDIKPKEVYSSLGAPTKPTIEGKYPWVPWDEVYPKITSCSKINYIKDISYQSIHNALPTGERLQKFRMKAEYFCALCRKENELETLNHLFTKCDKVQKTLKFLERKLQKNSLTNTQILYFTDCNEDESNTLAIYKYAIWKIRCKSKLSKENKGVESSILNYTKSLIDNPNIAIKFDATDQ